MFINRLFKTQDKQPEFVHRLTNIVKGNDSLRNRFIVSFEQYGTFTAISFTDLKGKAFDIISLMSTREYTKYIDLMRWWMQ